MPLGIPDNLRPEHGVIVAKTGGGKSQLLEKLIIQDLEQPDPPGMLIIDSKTDNDTTVFRDMSLFHRISRLDVFHPLHGRLRDRLIIIDPVQDKPALNMFDFRGELTNAKVNQIYDSMKYFFAELLGNDLSGQMETVFVPLLHIILRKPGATLLDLRNLANDPLQYPDVVAQLPDGIRTFLTEDVAAKGKRTDAYGSTKVAIKTRIQSIINRVTLDAMFSAASTAIDVAEELGKGSIILVSTNARDLRDDFPIFGKYWISQMLNAGMAKTTNRRIHFYCDETAPYIDSKLTSLLTTIRSYNVGVMLAFQGVYQMGGHARAILSNTETKFLGRGEPGDAEALAPFFKGMDADNLMAVQSSQTEGRFAFTHRDLAKSVVVRFPFGELDKLSRMSEADYRLLRTKNKARVEGTPTNIVTFPKKPPPVEPAFTLEDHARIIVLLWTPLEKTIIAAGGVTEDGDLDINRLNISREDKDRLNELRRQRNRFIHDHQMITDLDEWERDARNYTKVLGSIDRTDPSDASSER